MRKLVFCLAGGAAALVMMDHVGASNGASTFGPALLSSGVRSVAVNRTHKSDRATPVVRHQAGTEHKIATVEVVGLQEAAIVYRDGDGRVLFRTDPVGNATVVVRGLSLPAVTVRDSSATTAQPMVIEAPQTIQAPQTAPAKRQLPAKQKPAKQEPKIPDGCELAFSPLSELATSGPPARCVAELPKRSRLASLH